MQYALKQETLDNAISSCIGCGIRVTVCPMDTPSYGKDGYSRLAVLPAKGTHQPDGQEELVQS